SSDLRTCFCMGRVEFFFIFSCGNYSGRFSSGAFRLRCGTTPRHECVGLPLAPFWFLCFGLFIRFITRQSITFPVERIASLFSLRPLDGFYFSKLKIYREQFCASLYMPWPRPVAWSPCSRARSHAFGLFFLSRIC